MIKGLVKDQVIRLPRGLVSRIVKVLEDEGLGYRDFPSFVLEAVRHQLERAERAAYWLKQEGDR